MAEAETRAAVVSGHPEMGAQTQEGLLAKGGPLAGHREEWGPVSLMYPGAPGGDTQWVLGGAGQALPCCSSHLMDRGGDRVLSLVGGQSWYLWDEHRGLRHSGAAFPDTSQHLSPTSTCRQEITLFHYVSGISNQLRLQNYSHV